MIEMRALVSLSRVELNEQQMSEYYIVRTLCILWVSTAFERRSRAEISLCPSILAIRRNVDALGVAGVPSICGAVCDTIYDTVHSQK